MKEQLELAVSEWYKCWLLTNDEYEAMPDFQMIIEDKFKNITFTKVGNEWKII